MWCTLDGTYDESWYKGINCHDSSSYYTAWTLIFERVLSLFQNQYETLNYKWNPNVVIYSYGLITVNGGW